MDIKFSNFKCFAGEHSIKVAPLTLIYGQNSAGKSTLLQLMKLAYLQDPIRNLSGFEMDRFYWLHDQSGVPISELWAQVEQDHVQQKENVLGGALRPNYLGEGIELAANHKKTKNIKIEINDHLYMTFFWLAEDAYGESSISSLAVEWEFKDEDWYPAALELGVEEHDDGSTLIRGKAVVARNVIQNWTPYLKLEENPKDYPSYTSYEFEPKDIHQLLMTCLGENGHHYLTTIEIFGDDAYSGESFETLFPDKPWIWGKESEGGGFYNHVYGTEKYLNQWSELVEWRKELHTPERDFDATDISFSNFDRKQDVEVVKEFSQIYKENPDIKILLRDCWRVFGVDDPFMVTVIETLLTAYLIPHLPYSPVWQTVWDEPARSPALFSEKGSEPNFEQFLRADERGRRMGLEISSLRPQIPQFIPQKISDPEFILDDNPTQYLNWICNEKAKGRSIYTKAKALRKINEAFVTLEVPHKLLMKEISNEDSSDTDRLEVRFKDLRNNTIVSPQHVGTGTSQLLPIIAACELRNELIPIIIQQPELHLHPKLQANLGEYLYEKRNSDYGEFSPILIETHSELLILRILKLIKEGKADPSDVAVNYIANTEDGPLITELRIGEDGEFIDEWPAGFFEEQGDELFN